jgi:tRNA threonylcarbamoyladenosine biosynthesis protein TsaE
MISKSLEDTKREAQELAQALKPKANQATVVALSGDLGAGKTTFVKYFAESVGIPATEITSPTFVIMKSYDISANGFKKFIHIDAYRLEKAEEIEKLGWRNLIGGVENLIFVEWPENIKNALPKEVKKISFRFIDENTREIVFN